MPSRIFRSAPGDGFQGGGFPSSERKNGNVALVGALMGSSAGQDAPAQQCSSQQVLSQLGQRIPISSADNLID